MQAQTFSSWELVVADDGSDDGSPQLIEKLAANDHRVVSVLTDDVRSGAAAARNIALGCASGRYIAFLDADDEWHPSKLEVQFNEMQKTGAAFSCSGYLVCRENRADYIRMPPSVITRRSLLKGNRIGCLTAMYDPHVFGKQPMVDIPMRHDYALWLHLLSLSPNCLGIQRTLATHKRRSGSLSANPWKTTAATWKMLRRQAGLGSIAATRAVSSHVIRRLWRG